LHTFPVSICASSLISPCNFRGPKQQSRIYFVVALVHLHREGLQFW
jgi:hypothetical protein